MVVVAAAAAVGRTEKTKVVERLSARLKTSLSVFSPSGIAQLWRRATFWTHTRVSLRLSVPFAFTAVARGSPPGSPKATPKGTPSSTSKSPQACGTAFHCKGFLFLKSNNETESNEGLAGWTAARLAG